MVLDAHVHFWNYDPNRDTWITEEMRALKRQLSPEDYKSTTENLNISGCIAVQADESEEETQFLLDLAEKHDVIRAVLGWVDLSAEDVEVKLKKFSKNRLLKGIRCILQDKNDDFMLSKGFLNGISKLQQYKLTYDILVHHLQLEKAIKLVEKFPKQPFILDHLGKPDIKNGNYRHWEQNIAELAQFENVHCKISGMVTEADWNNWKKEDFEFCLDTVFSAFGINKVVFASDWPVCNLAGNFSRVLDLVQTFTANFNKAEKEAFYYKNAQKFYKIDN
ncbi:amidohydrolase family protein [Salegentibacter sp. F188]|uniref:Amidohydrolase family protein n=1 Tax=Autumnicola patrickiae TaxID=3075591 RepID=A0ABU3E163_9FLAO|nr:amidohydrolase family protein [Salegentibacter sp. F188]MDT0689707.1 amidohydrolase family protein [Salegentibacter sp. F188]